MPGFYVSNLEVPPRLENVYDDMCVYDEMRYGSLVCARNTLNRFMDDKAFAETSQYLIIAEGLLLNKKELFGEWDCSDLASLVCKMYEHLGDCFFASFRGSFSGAVYDKSQEKWIVYTNHYGDKPVFYYFDEDGRFALGSQVNYVLNALKEAKTSISLDESAVYSMLTYAYMIDERTYAIEIKRLMPGQYLTLSNGELFLHRYYRPKQNQMDLSGWSEVQILEELDSRFRKALNRAFAKDDEYGYLHLADMSGGLDSRMTNWVANDQGYEPVLNIAYSQSGYLDETVAAAISRDLGNQFLFKSLDDASFLFDAERIVEMNFGLGLYAGITGGESMLRHLNLSEYGAEHTGQVGDVVVGCFLRNENELNTIEHSGMYSEKLLHRLNDPSREAYKDREQFLFEVRGFLGCLSSHLIRQNYTEVTSPFLDIDFLDYCLSIPVSHRINHKLYFKWIKTFYRAAGEYIWEAYGVKPNANKVTKALKGGLIRIKKYIAQNLIRNGKGSSMNPIEYWGRSNPKISEYFDKIYNGCKARSVVSDGLWADIAGFYDKATVLEKTQIITALVAIDYYLDHAFEGTF